MGALAQPYIAYHENRLWRYLEIVYVFNVDIIYMYFVFLLFGKAKELLR